MSPSITRARRHEDESGRGGRGVGGISPGCDATERKERGEEEGGEADRQAGRQTHRHTDRERLTLWYSPVSASPLLGAAAPTGPTREHHWRHSQPQERARLPHWRRRRAATHRPGARRRHRNDRRRARGHALQFKRHRVSTRRVSKYHRRGAVRGPGPQSERGERSRKHGDRRCGALPSLPSLQARLTHPPRASLSATLPSLPSASVRQSAGRASRPLPSAASTSAPPPQSRSGG